MINQTLLKVITLSIGKLLLFSLMLIAGCNNSQSEMTIIGDTGAQLQMLRVSGLALSPSFEITQKHYVSTADYSVTKIKLQAWGRTSDASITVNGLPLKKDDHYVLAVGNNLFNISVSNNNNVSEQYQLTVVRLPKSKFNS